jgi:hypothetical protein
VWRIDLPDISGTHMHPADLRGAIVSLDRSQPYGTWRWGGPEWTGRVGSGAPGRLQGITVGVADPAEAASRWSHVLGVPVSTHDGLLIELDDGWVVFREAPAAVESIEEIAVALPPEVRAGRAAVEVGSALIVLSDMPA